MSSPVEIMQALADQVSAALGTADPMFEDLHVYPLMKPSPTPPAIDFYPDEEFQVQNAMGAANREEFYIARARIATAEHDGAQRVLLTLMHSRDSLSLVQAIEADNTLGGKVSQAHVSNGPSGFRAYQDIGSPDAFLGFECRVRVQP